MNVALLPLALLGGFLGLDVVSFPQAMMSRPLVAATLAGALCGRPTSGLLVGAALELIALETLPFGASRYPEWGSAAVVGGALFSSSPTRPAGAMTIAVLAALATAMVGGWTMVKVRELNGRWSAGAREVLETGSRDSVMRLQLRGLTADFARGVALTWIALAVFAPLGTAMIHVWTVDARFSRAMVVAVAGAVTAGAAWKLFHSVPRALWFLGAGIVLSAAFLVLQ